MSYKKKVLFIVRAFKHSAPQPIRFRKIIPFLLDDYDIDVLMFHHGKNIEKEVFNNGHIYKIPYTIFGRRLSTDIRTTDTKKNILDKKQNNILKRILSNLKLKKYIFPDPFIFNVNKLKKNVLKLVEENEYDIVVGSSQPHSVITASKTVKEKFSHIKWVHDLGDPLHAPTSGSNRLFIWLGKIFENYYSKSVDQLVVTNSATKEYYVNRYNKYHNDNVNVIPQGADLRNGKIIKERLSSKPYKFMYAGTFYDRLREPYELYKALKSKEKEIDLKLFGAIARRHLPTNLENFSFSGPTSHSKILEWYENADVIIFIDNAYGLQTPGKSFEVLSLQKPVLFIYENEKSPTLELYKELPYSVNVKNDKLDIMRGIEELFIMLEKGSATSTKKLNEYSWKQRAIEFKSVIEKI